MKIENGYNIYTAEELAHILKEHAEFLLDNSKGARADLTRSNLTGADLTRSNLTWADLTQANLTRSNLTWANLTGANLTRANLTRANLTGADLIGADLTRANLIGADLDFSAFPLWCGGADFKCNMKLVYQLLAHIATLKVQDEKEEFEKFKETILPYAKKSHRWEDLKDRI